MTFGDVRTKARATYVASGLETSGTPADRVGSVSSSEIGPAPDRVHHLGAKFAQQSLRQSNLDHLSRSQSGKSARCTPLTRLLKARLNQPQAPSSTLRARGAAKACLTGSSSTLRMSGAAKACLAGSSSTLLAHGAATYDVTGWGFRQRHPGLPCLTGMRSDEPRVPNCDMRLEVIPRCV